MECVYISEDSRRKPTCQPGAVIAPAECGWAATPGRIVSREQVESATTALVYFFNPTEVEL